MKQYLGILFLILLLTGIAFAANPTVQNVTVSPFSKGLDQNYFTIPATITAFCADADNDLNNTYCEYKVSDEGSWVAGSMAADTNICSATIVLSTENDDFNFNIKCFDELSNEDEGDKNVVWRDSTAPTTTLNISQPSGSRTITLTCNDVATNTGLGSGCSSTSYRINGGTWQDYSAPISFPYYGSFSFDYNSRDSLDNVEDIHSYTFYVGVVPSASCSMLTLSLFIFIVSIVVMVLISLMRQDKDIKGLALVIIVGIIISIIAYTLLSSTACAL